MPRLFLIRHGEPEAGWGEADDPGLSATGVQQAEAAAAALAGVGSLALVSSPLRRCRETAAAAERMIGSEARVDLRVGEVRTPPDTADRRAWLGETFPWGPGAAPTRWSDRSNALVVWRDDVLSALGALAQDSAIFTHFIAINVIVGAALGRDETIVCRPAHASITELVMRDGGALALVQLGAEMHNGDVR